MSASFLVTGGTGTLGRLVVPLLRAAGRDVRVLSRRPRELPAGVEHVTGDLLTGEGVDRGVAGADVVVHLAGGPKGDDRATATLARAAAAAGVRHLVLISVIGADQVPLGYFRAKLDAERAVSESGVPWTTLRAAQFHDLVLTVAKKMTALPVVPAPGGLRFQPVDARDVAARLVELAVGEPAGRVRDLAGPSVHGMDELLRGYLRETGRRRPLLPVRIPGAAGRAYRAGDNLNLDTADRGRRSWEEFLTERSAVVV
ncbi:SDR family oxidoreductase [Pseudonocardia lacus]|uniref:SDR family oxidoreductase n=1 Tax=Pseudonocardia lacus TaxID=2835865 RepID=UPI001BDD2B53|nr:SDR family oxidoreductase [Pseudonocardia lacus]